VTDRRVAEKIALALQRAEDEKSKGTITTDRIKELLNDTLRSAGLEQIKSIRLKDWLSDWLASKRNISPSSRLGYEQATREFLEYTGSRQNAPLESISERDIDGFINHLVKGGRGSGTINKLVRKYLSGAFEKARKLGKIKYNPTAATDALEYKSSRSVGCCSEWRLGGNGSLWVRIRRTAPGCCKLALERSGS
jgi:hypothetical protein